MRVLPADGDSIALIGLHSSGWRKMMDRNLWSAPTRTILAILALPALTSAAHAAPSRDCLSQVQAAKVYPGKFLKYREIGSFRCWFAGRTPDKSEFKIVPASAEPLDSRAAPLHRVEAAPVERLRSDMGAQRPDVVAAAARPAETSEERKATANDLVGLEGTLCPGPCEDLRTIDPNELRARHEAARATFVEYWTNFNERWAPMTERILSEVGRRRVGLAP